jgi:hypothetical protein
VQKAYQALLSFKMIRAGATRNDLRPFNSVERG